MDCKVLFIALVHSTTVKRSILRVMESRVRIDRMTEMSLEQYRKPSQNRIMVWAAIQYMKHRIWLSGSIARLQRANSAPRTGSHDTLQPSIHIIQDIHPASYSRGYYYFDDR